MTNIIIKALDIANKYHADQKRDGGLPYVSHLISVYSRLRPYYVYDQEVLASALLHDTIEDTKYTEGDLRSDFGDRVHMIVMQLTNNYSDHLPHEEKLVATKNKASLITDPAAQAIKIVDRLDNLIDAAVCWKPARYQRYLENTKALLEGLPFISIQHSQFLINIGKGQIAEILDTDIIHGNKT